MPCLLLRKRALVKTVKFSDPKYVGDPVNTVRIFNEKEVDELIFLDITATPEGREPQFELVADIASECFMPFAYGGGVRTIEHVARILSNGAEKVAINTAAVETPALVTEAARRFGSQAVVGAIDAKKKLLGGYEVRVRGGKDRTGLDPVSHARQLEALGAGEILITSIDQDGTMSGYDLDLTRRVAEAVNVPVIACGGAGSVEDFRAAVKDAGASAVAAGSMVVYQGRHRAVLINFPHRQTLEKALGYL